MRDPGQFRAVRDPELLQDPRDVHTHPLGDGREPPESGYTVPERHRSRLAQVCDELADQPGLADAGLAITALRADMDPMVNPGTSLCLWAFPGTTGPGSKTRPTQDA